MSKPTIAFADHFADLPDPRVDRTRKHLLGDILVIAVCAVIAGAGADGSHEIAAIPALLEVLALKGALVTIDAAGCQVEIARRIRERKGHYLLAVKGNQPGLYEAVRAVFDRACAADFAGVRHD